MTSNSFLASGVSLRRLATLQEGEFFVNRSSSDMWLTGPAVVNAFYAPSLASISKLTNICWKNFPTHDRAIKPFSAFPAGILQPPFLGADYPEYWNYGAVGTVIGHEMTHGFDNVGMMRNQ